MPGITRPVRDLTSYYGSVGLVVIALDHVAIGIALGNNRTEGIGMDVCDSRLGLNLPSEQQGGNHELLPCPSDQPDNP
ncbi:hypothetical protein D3C72_1421150 [compost metagenome]